MYDRRSVLGGLAALPLLAPWQLRAQGRQGPIIGKIALEDNRVWVGATIGGKPPALFIVDTGATVSMIQPAYLQTLNLRRLSPTRLVGVGGPEQFMLYEARDVVFGGAIRQAIAVFAAPNRDLGLPRDAAGLLAAGLLTSVDSELDFDSNEWRVYPQGRGERPGFDRLPSTIRSMNSRGGSDKIFVTGVLDGRSYRLLVDTGMPTQLALYGDAMRRSGLWNGTTPFVPIQPRGIGGMADRGRLVRGSRLSIGNIVFDRPLISLSRDTALGGTADGIIGLELMECLTLSTDVRGDRLWAKRNARAPRLERYGLSGLWMEERAGSVFVAEVSPASPAADAGIKIGDEVLGGPLLQQIRRLGGRPGQHVELTIRRGGETRSLGLTLREYL